MLTMICMLTGHEMDVRDLQFDDESFDVAIDKGLSLRGHVRLYNRLRFVCRYHGRYDDIKR